MGKFVWRIVVCSNYEEDADAAPYTVDFDTFEEAEEAYNLYCSELTLSGQRAYSCVPPFSVEVVNL